MRHALAAVVAAAISLGMSAGAQPVSSAFVYQGEIREAGSPSAGPVDLRFRLYDVSSGGSQVGGCCRHWGRR